MTVYQYRITDADTSLSKIPVLVGVGNRTFEFTFSWDDASEEQYMDIVRYFETRAQADPLRMQDGNYNRTYDWFSFYIDLLGVDLNEWVNNTDILPVSVIGKSNTEKVRILNIYREEANAFLPIVNQYSEMLRWQCRVTCPGIEDTSTFVVPGGWNRNQDDVYAYRFVSEKDIIRKEDLNDVTIEFEVYDE